ncbi:MAG: carbohydrate porin [Fusobacteriaceae bacterium]
MLKKQLLLLSILLLSKESYSQNLEVKQKQLEERLKIIEEQLEKTSSEQNKQENNNDNFEFHGVMRAGADGKINEHFKKAYDKEKTLLGRAGNEYDSYTSINFSKRYTAENGMWGKLYVELDNWNNEYNPYDDINLAFVRAEFGGVPMFTGAFQDMKIVAGKSRWDDRYVDQTDYFPQDFQGVGIAFNNISVGPGKIGLTYISSEFQDRSEQYYLPTLDKPWEWETKDNVGRSDSIRAIKALYKLENIDFEFMYASSSDHDTLKTYSEGDKKFTRTSSEDGIYGAIYYNPKNYYGMNGWGQHYAQIGTGVLAGAGLGRLNTTDNMMAHEDSLSFQIGTGGRTNITEKISIMSTLRYTYGDKVDSREHEISYGAHKPYLTNFVKEQQQLGLAIRPIYAVNYYFDLWAELGYSYVDSEAWDNVTKSKRDLFKISIGPELKLNYSSAQITFRPYLTYFYDINDKKELEISTTGEPNYDLVKNKTSKKDKDGEFVGGFQVSAWW